MTEHEIQKSFFEWTEYNLVRLPELKWMFAIPNGGKRDIRVAMKLKAEGVKPGVLDTFLPSTRKGYAGLFIEFKKHGNTTTENQDGYIDHLTKEGYLCRVAFSAKEAIQIVEDYLKK